MKRSIACQHIFMHGSAVNGPLIAFVFGLKVYYTDCVSAAIIASAAIVCKAANAAAFTIMISREI